jgi:hypothetical protein
METTGGQMPGRWMIHRAKDSCSEHSHPKNSQSCFLHPSRDRLMAYPSGRWRKDKRQKRKNAQSWGWVDWVLGWRHTTTSSTSGEFIIYNGKTRRWAAVLQGMGHGIIVLWTGEICDCFSLNVSSHVYILGKSAMLHFALTLSCSWGHAKLSLQVIGHNYVHTLLWLGPCQTQSVDYLAQLCLHQVFIGLSNSAFFTPYVHLCYYLKCSWRSPSPKPSSCLCTMWNLTERTRKQVNNNTLIPAKYQKECFSMLKGLQSLNSSWIVFSYSLEK